MLMQSPNDVEDFRSTAHTFAGLAAQHLQGFAWHIETGASLTLDDLQHHLLEAKRCLRIALSVLEEIEIAPEAVARMQGKHKGGKR